ncbi:hypothetical protein BC628DRAFT_1104048 [Trametes gibbosa]|nr:hypothetical protein BC628DRAFT_1104048 [Trametes gibbosa]
MRARATVIWHIQCWECWVPVPLMLFAGVEHRTFLCHATVTVQYGDERAVDVIAVSVSAGMEHLCSEWLAVPLELAL